MTGTTAQTRRERSLAVKAWLPGWLRRLSWQWLAIAVVSGGIIHILATLVVPKLASGSAWHRLAGKLPANRMIVLPPAIAGSQPLPFIGPDVRMALCRFDLSQGAVVIAATLPDKGWTLGLYSREGDNFFAVPAQEFRRAEVRFTLVPPADSLLGLFNWGRGVDTTASQVSVPRSDGLVVLRAPMRGRAYQSEIEALLARASCSPQR